MNKLIAFVLALALALTLVGCNKEKSNENNETHIFQGEIIEFDNGAMLVEPLEGYSEAEYAQRIRVVIQNMPGSPEPRVGDIIEVTYSGIMTEESPPSPTGVEKIVVIKRTPDDEIIDPKEDEHLISVTSGGSMIHPFWHFAYSEHWAEDGFLCADGTPAGGELKEWSEESSLPEIEWSEDFTVTYADGVDFQYIMVFNEAREQQDHLFAVSDLSELDSGRYYIGIVVSQKGQYIEQAKQAECTGWVCLFKLVVEHIEGFSSPTEEELRIRFPQYYDLITPKGLEVYVWQTADNVYYCGLLPGTNRGATEDEITDLAANGATVEEMKVILSSYDDPYESIFMKVKELLGDSPELQELHTFWTPKKPIADQVYAVRIITYPQNAGTTTTGLLHKQRGCIYSKSQDEYYAGKEARHGKNVYA